MYNAYRTDIYIYRISCIMYVALTAQLVAHQTSDPRLVAGWDRVPVVALVWLVWYGQLATGYERARLSTGRPCRSIGRHVKLSFQINATDRSESLGGGSRVQATSILSGYPGPEANH